MSKPKGAHITRGPINRDKVRMRDSYCRATWLARHRTYELGYRFGLFEFETLRFGQSFRHDLLAELDRVVGASDERPARHEGKTQVLADFFVLRELAGVYK